MCFTGGVRHQLFHLVMSLLPPRAHPWADTSPGSTFQPSGVPTRLFESLVMHPSGGIDIRAGAISPATARKKAAAAAAEMVLGLTTLPDHEKELHSQQRLRKQTLEEALAELRTPKKDLLGMKAAALPATTITPTGTGMATSTSVPALFPQSVPLPIASLTTVTPSPRTPQPMSPFSPAAHQSSLTLPLSARLTAGTSAFSVVRRSYIAVFAILFSLSLSSSLSH
jgi:hypothetical protein